MKFSLFVREKFDPAGTAARRGVSRPQTSPSPWLKIPAMDPQTHTLSEIFSSVLGPLVEFDKLADEFVERKDVVSKQVEAIALRRKTQAVPAAEAKPIESAWAKIQTEERTTFAPRLDYLAEMYFRRSSELMHRSQMLAEQRFAVGQRVLQAAPAEKPAAQLEADAKRRELDEEMASFQKLAQQNQHLNQLVLKYGLKGPDAQMRREMIPQQQQKAA